MLARSKNSEFEDEKRRPAARAHESSLPLPPLVPKACAKAFTTLYTTPHTNTGVSFAVRPPHERATTREPRPLLSLSRLLATTRITSTHGEERGTA
ncbi:hypothetical protein VYU27_008656 [Nannochloropsis oceanica]